MYNGLSVAVFVFLLVNVALLMMLPRRWAFVPVIIGACFMTQGQGFEIGPFTFSVLRLIAIAGVTRIVLRRETIAGGFGRLDRILLLWAAWGLCSSVFHRDPGATMIEALGTIYDAFSLYFLVRVFCTSISDVKQFCRATVVLLAPLAVSMTYEVVAMRNVFAIFGSVNETPNIRNGRVRASGPFRHPILAGTAGAVCIPLAISVWRTYPASAVVGSVSAVTMIVASGSSGPVMSAAASLLALFLWPLRRQMKLVRWSVVALYAALEIVMKAPAYYIIARFDVVGGSTGWHRAALIESAIKHLDEWWIGGTDYTRHWMPTGVTWSPDHTDITSQYLINGVAGGLLLMALFVAMICVAFSIIGECIRRTAIDDGSEALFFWALGSSLFSHVVTCLSVSYYDQSRCYIYFLLASIGSVASKTEIVRSTVEGAADSLQRTFWWSPELSSSGHWFGRGRDLRG